MLLDDSSWPADVRWLREQFVADWQKFAVHDQSGHGFTPGHIDHALGSSPRFFVGHNGKLVLSVPGLSGWKTKVAPLLAELVGT
jgi:hypothetical protein